MIPHDLYARVSADRYGWYRPDTDDFHFIRGTATVTDLNEMADEDPRSLPRYAEVVHAPGSYKIREYVRLAKRLLEIRRYYLEKHTP